MRKCIYSWQCVIDLVETGKNIRKIRQGLGLSVMDVSDFFYGMSRNSIYKWERGETLPSLENLYALAWFFRVSLDELIVGNRESLDCDDDQLVELIIKILLKSRANMRENACLPCFFVVTFQVDDKHLSFKV